MIFFKIKQIKFQANGKHWYLHHLSIILLIYVQSSNLLARNILMLVHFGCSDLIRHKWGIENYNPWLHMYGLIYIFLLA